MTTISDRVVVQILGWDRQLAPMFEASDIARRLYGGAVQSYRTSMLLFVTVRVNHEVFIHTPSLLHPYYSTKRAGLAVMAIRT